MVYVDGLSCLIECKHWREPVDFGPIAKLKVRVDRRPPPVIGLLFSVSGFTGPAWEEFQSQPLRNLLLWRRSDVDRALKHGMRTALGIKWRQAVEEAVMDYELEEEDFR
ncbi:restriction endonuclease [Archangium sp.]|uniref:restriction endonuclease n=1 Tax=Archangium sp. TaxID=1872627 RepID=UPI00286A993B|nr:restriction endonuclease [Archangium sp.]